MVDSTQIQSDFAKVVSDIGMIISIEHQGTHIDDDGYDDDVISCAGSKIWTSGIVQPLSFGNSPSSAYNKTLLEQGLIAQNDSVLYLKSGTSVESNGDDKITIGLGSPTQDEYKLIEGANKVSTQVNGNVCYQKLFIRRITTGQ